MDDPEWDQFAFQLLNCGTRAVIRMNTEIQLHSCSDSWAAEPGKFVFLTHHYQENRL